MGRKKGRKKKTTSKLIVSTTESLPPAPVAESLPPAPVGVNYYAISPEDNFTTHELKQVDFEQLFEVIPVKHFEELFPNVSSVSKGTQPILVPLLEEEVAKAESEGLMNAAIQDALKDFLSEDLPEVGCLEIEPKTGLVKEMQLWNLMNTAYGENRPHEAHANGLPISLESLPDFSIWSKSNTFLLTGEGKNQSKYDFLDCRRQATAYMLAHLFRWIVWKSKAVEAVYGVAFCGPGCTRMEGMPFQVALLRLSLPTHVGGKLQLHQFTISQHSNNDLNFLWKFADCVSRIDGNNAEDIKIGANCPARLLLPRETLSLSPEDISGKWHMVENGTGFLVICLDSEEGFDFFSTSLGFEEYKREQFINNFQAAEVVFPCYLKVKNHLGSNHPDLLDFYLSQPMRPTDFAWDLQEAYKVKPKRNANATVIVVSDMGRPIGDYFEDQGMDYTTFCREYSDLMHCTVTLEMKLGLNHGDIHMGNLVYGQKLSLIDFDEGQDRTVTVRKPASDIQKRIHVAGLRKKPIAFTKNQLVNLFCDCWVLYFQPSLAENDNVMPINTFVQNYHNFFLDGQSPSADQVLTCFNLLAQMLQNVAVKQGVEQGVEVSMSDDGKAAIAKESK